MIDVVIIEDDENCRVLAELLDRYKNQINIVGQANSIKEALTIIAEQKPQLVFLNIDLQPDNSLQILEALPEIDFQLIFVTQTDHCPLKVITLGAIDCLHKPIIPAELQLAITKTQKRLNHEGLIKNLGSLLHNFKNRFQNSYRIALPTHDGVLFVNVSDIIYCESNGPYTIFMLKQPDKIVISKHLKEYEDLLNGFNFFRIHKSYLVNLQEIQKYIRGEGGHLIMSNGDKLAVSKHRREEFLGIYFGG
jgi:two-component system LytT family response regulator